MASDAALPPLLHHPCLLPICDCGVLAWAETDGLDLARCSRTLYPMQSAHIGFWRGRERTRSLDAVDSGCTPEPRFGGI